MRVRIFLILFLILLAVVAVVPSLRGNPDITHEVTYCSAEVATVIGYDWIEQKYCEGDTFYLNISSVSPTGVVENVRAFNFSDGDYIALYCSYHYDLTVKFGDINDGENDTAVITSLSVSWSGGWVKAYLDGVEVVHGIHGSGSFSDSGKYVKDGILYLLYFANFTECSLTV